MNKKIERWRGLVPDEDLATYDKGAFGNAIGMGARAAVTDAFSHNFRVIVVEEACGDRSQAAHQANLFDMDMKFADVEKLDDVAAALQRHYGAAAKRQAAGGA